MQHLIVHSNPLFAEALATALESCAAKDMITACGAASAEAIVGEVTRLCPRILVAPYGPADLGAQCTRRILELRPDTQIIIIDVPENDDEILRLIRCGVAGYSVLGAPLQDLKSNLEAIHRGETLCSARIARLLYSQLSSHPGPPMYSASRGAHLTPREIEIIRLIEQGLQNKEIARNLGIELQTVKNHVHNILEKLQVTGRREAVRYAKEVGLLTYRHAAITISTSTPV